MIDWSFIGDREARTLVGYVPDPAKSRSGVTIATGVDIGNMPPSMFAVLGSDLQPILKRYVGLIREDAVDALALNPLTITPAQADKLDAVAHQSTVSYITASYNRYSRIPFASIPDRAQTVITSVAYQYGNLPIRCPKFWACVTRQDWAGAVGVLKAFGDAYQTRHDLEAAYLEPVINQDLMA